ncbi:MAG: M20/M25/M40 family metallo-hydrolase [Gammaproteobacteria bacterium]|nr:M20/M25/M40 family metallo-hydrolase [Gammaproteobacteria bacterium]
MKAVLGVLVTSVVLLLGVIVVRTILHEPEALGRVERVAINLDEDLIGHHLSEAIRFKTVSYQQQDDFQAEEFEAFIDWVKNTYPEVNETMELMRLGGYTLLYRWEGSDSSLKPILVTGHYDVVPVIPGSEKQWQHPPFGGDIVDGVIWGRGALDDKSAVIAQLEAATYLVRTGFAPKRTIYFSFGHDEEVGGTKGAAKVVEYLADQSVQLAWSLDEGSFLFDGVLPGVEPLTATINVAEKGSVTLNIIAKSTGGHSSMPPRQTAVGILAEAITALEANPVPGGLSGLSEQMFDTVSRYMSFGSRVLFANRWLFGGLIENRLSEVPFSNAMLRTTTAPTMLSGSVKVNVLPIEAVATVNFRLHPRDSVEGVVDHVKSVVENANVEIQLPPGSGRAASPVSSWDSVGYRVVKTAIRETYGEVVVTPGLMIAGSDSRHYGKVADDAYRFNPMTVSQEDLTGFHGTNEKISVANLTQGTRAYARIVRLGSME